MTLERREVGGVRGRIAAVLSWFFLLVPLGVGAWVIALHRPTSLRAAVLCVLVGLIGAPFLYPRRLQQEILFWQGAGYMIALAVALAVAWPIYRWPGTNVLEGTPTAAFAFMAGLVVVFGLAGYGAVRLLLPPE